ncbi:helix-turn-helix domain-containing protein [Pseudolactococcus piscium]|uniref:helix-turn-helix domain-containing protein n=1 Tax=Pseudolactococcus piscium TaxID=1364 RepID=UPI000BDF56B0|nr:helix-turn-helix transcriptional regulator [Lactococcus piscium]
MLKVTDIQAKAIRRKRADLGLTKKLACREIGIGYVTLNNIERGDYMTKPSIYVKVMEWLAKDY